MHSVMNRRIIKRNQKDNFPLKRHDRTNNRGHLLPALFGTTQKGVESAAATTPTETSTTASTRIIAGTDSKMKSITGIQSIVNEYDIFLLDMWGIMHDGHTPYAGVLELITKLCPVASKDPNGLNGGVEPNKRLIILSNSSKRQDHSIRMLKQLGFDPNDFEQIITSGEVTYQVLQSAASSSSSSSLDETNGSSDNQWSIMTDLISKNNNNQSPAKTVFVLGSGDGDEEYCNSCGWTLSML